MYLFHTLIPVVFSNFTFFSDASATFQRVNYDKLDDLGSIQWPCNEVAPAGTPTMHVDQFARGKGVFALTEFVATDERANRRFPLLLTTGRILSQYNVGAQPRRTANNRWYQEDILELHPQDAEERGISEGDWVGLQSRVGNTVLRVSISNKVQPGVVYTTFHFPTSGANVIATDHADWATGCPEYKVTAVQLSKVTEPSEWQKRYLEFSKTQDGFRKNARDKRASCFVVISSRASYELVLKSVGYGCWNVGCGICSHRSCSAVNGTGQHDISWICSGR